MEEKLLSALSDESVHLSFLFIAFQLFFFINNSASCKKLVIMKTTLICRNADYSCLLECG